MYYLYHIPGKKIGVTRDLNTRVTLMQGYKENEYEVLEQSDDIDYISDREIELQKSYGYKRDRTLLLFSVVSVISAVSFFLSYDHSKEYVIQDC